MNVNDLASWPVLIVSGHISRASDEGRWLDAIVDCYLRTEGGAVESAGNFHEAHDLVFAREDFGCVLVDWDLAAAEGQEHRAPLLAGLNPAQNLISFVHERNRSLPIVILTNRHSVEDLPDQTLAAIDGTMWKLTDTSDYLAGRIGRHVRAYVDGTLPPFFKELVTYVEEYKYAWHTPGHMGGEGFLKSPSGTAFHKFFGEDVLRADLSISVPELGSLLDHSGVTGLAERDSARIFGADTTYYVLNGTSTANQIIWHSVVSPELKQATLMDRNCHKSLNHAMIVTNARPTYLWPIHNGIGIIGPVDFTRIPNADGGYAMAALTNSTYDGVCYDTQYAAGKLAGAGALHFDEAWYAYACFHPIYENHYGMRLKHSKRAIYASQSTHKLLTAFSQASMIHVKLPESIHGDEKRTRRFSDRFNESYMMHSSTSPQYNMIASLEVASKMMADNGTIAWDDMITEAVQLRKKVGGIARRRAARGDWFFDLWQPPEVMERSVEELAGDQAPWLIRKQDSWHGFELPDTYTMLDPIKLTFLCPGVDVDGNFSKPGIPAAIVTNYLIRQGIVAEKTDYYSWLMLHSLGTTRGKQGTVLAELFRFHQAWKDNQPLKEVFPDLVSQHPEHYGDAGLRDHATAMHRYIQEHDLLGKLRDAFNDQPSQIAAPAEAFSAVVRGKVKMTRLNDIDPTRSRIAGVMLVPYPPGIPMLMGGEAFDESSRDILEYLKARQSFENEFPGYESDIHGIERQTDGEGHACFATFLMDDPASHNAAEEKR